MNENIIQVLMYIFEEHFNNDEAQPLSMQNLLEDLLEAGFDRDTIYKALDWLREILALHQAESTHIHRKNNGFRVFTPQENHQLSPEVQGFILYLERAGILDQVTRERVINRLLAAEGVNIEVEHVKLMALLVLDHDREEYPQALQAMEMLLEAREHNRLH